MDVKLIEIQGKIAVIPVMTDESLVHHFHKEISEEIVQRHSAKKNTDKTIWLGGEQKRGMFPTWERGEDDGFTSNVNSSGFSFDARCYHCQ